MTVIALVLAAGEGLRLQQEVPKAWVRVAGRSLLDWSASALARAAEVDAVLPVIPARRHPAMEELRQSWRGPAQLLEPVEGGPTRQASMQRGLEAARRQLSSLEWVVVHDAARPCVEPSDVEAVLAAARLTGAALPVVPVADTVKELEDERVLRTLDRSSLGLAQTPQAFRLRILLQALEKATSDGFTGTDCAVLVERLGVAVRTCAGRVENLKLTHPADLARVAALLKPRIGAS